MLASFLASAVGSPGAEANTALRQKLSKLAENLSDLAVTAKKAGATKHLPAWVFQGPPFGLGQKGQTKPDRKALALIIRSKAPAKVRGLALMWLGSARHLDDLPFFERYLKSADAAGSYPMMLISQSVRPDYDIQWQSISLGDIAFRAATKIVGRNYGGPGGYQRWRKKQGDLRDSFDYWSNQAGKIRTPAQGKKELAPLLAHDPALFLRVLLMRGIVRAYPASDLQKLVREKIGAKKILRLVSLEEKWPEFNDASKYGRFCRWALDNWAELFQRQGAKKLLKLWRKPLFPKDVRWVRRHLAIATARANPRLGFKILTQALHQKPTSQMDAVLKELIATYLPQATAPAIAWFLRSETGEHDRLTIVRQMALAKKKGKRSLARLIRAKGFATDSAAIIGAMAKAIISWKGKLPPVCTGQLYPPRFKGRDTPQHQIDAVAQNRRTCVTSIRRWAKST